MNKFSQILEFIEDSSHEQVEFLKELCNINSFTYNKTGSDGVSALLCSELKDIFPNQEVHEQIETGDHHLLSTGGDGRSLYLLGHVDTVFPPDHPFQSCREDGEWLIGPGTADMKGGLIVFTYALKALHRARALPDYPIVLILGADEEQGSVSSKKIYMSERNKAFACLVAECGGENGEFVISRNGKMGVRLDCYGRDRHVGTPDSLKSSAVLEIAHKIINIEALNSLIPGIRTNAGRVEGGIGASTIPAHASLLLDIRWEKDEFYPALQNRLKKIAESNHQENCSSRMTILNRRPALPYHQKTRILAEKLRETAEGLRIQIKYLHRHGSSDANFFGSCGVPTLDGFGPVGIKDHTSEERILMSSLKERTSLLALFLHNLARSSY